MSEQTSLMIIAICQMLFVVIGIIAAAAILWAVLSFKKMVQQKMDEAMSRVQPVVDRATVIAEQAKETADKVKVTTDNISAKIDSIVGRAETTADKVSDRVDSVTSRVEQSVSPQVAQIAGIIGMGIKLYDIYRDMSASKAKTRVVRCMETPEGTVADEEVRVSI